MMFIAPCLAAKDGAGEETLAPERDEALCVEVLGVKGPESHANHMKGRPQAISIKRPLATSTLMPMRVAAKPALGVL
jgi:hypothetical protein